MYSEENDPAVTGAVYAPEAETHADICGEPAKTREYALALAYWFPEVIPVSSVKVSEPYTSVDQVELSGLIHHP